MRRIAMKRRLSSAKTRATLFLILFCSLAFQPWAKAGPPGSALLLGMEPSLLLGGFNEGRWWNIAPRDIMLEGGNHAPEDGCAEGREGGIRARHFLIYEDLPLVFYTPDGKRAGTAIAPGDAEYTCSEASGQAFLHPRLTALKREPGMESYTGRIVGVWKKARVAFVRTVKTVDKKTQSLTFAAAEAPGGKPLSITYRIDKKTDETAFTGTLSMNGGKFPLESSLTGDMEDIDGFFIDLNADGVLEFLEIVSNDQTGAIRLYSLRAPIKEPVLTIDMGE